MNTIVFRGVGIDMTTTDVGNYRIISNFTNKKGMPCFIEISHFKENGTLFGMVRQAYKIENGKEKHLFRTFDSMYNCTFPFTLNDILQAVNNLFDCKFTDVSVLTRKIAAAQ